MITATGFDPYEPQKGEYGYHEMENVITLPQFKRLIELNDKELSFNGNAIKGPAIIEQPTTTLVLTPDYQMVCDKYGDYMIRQI